MAELEQELRALRKRIAEGSPAPAVKDSLPLESIKALVSIFQHRTTRSWISTPHVEVMAKVLIDDPKASLDPIKVYWVGDGWCVIDGHHRLEAYELVRFSKPIPVEAFKGTLDEAVVEALRGNSRNKLQMSMAEKLNSAWRLTVVYPHLSKRLVVEASMVSDRTVAIMRATKEQLKALSLGDSLSEMSWSEARLRARGLEFDTDSSGFDYREHLKIEGEKLASRLAKSYGKSLHGDPNVLATALSILNGSFPLQLYEHWLSEGYYEERNGFSEFDEDAESDF